MICYLTYILDYEERKSFDNDNSVLIRWNGFGNNTCSGYVEGISGYEVAVGEFD